jgi:hypothetical protein
VLGLLWLQCFAHLPGTDNFYDRKWYLYQFFFDSPQSPLLITSHFSVSSTFNLIRIQVEEHTSVNNPNVSALCSWDSSIQYSFFKSIQRVSVWMIISPVWN